MRLINFHTEHPATQDVFPGGSRDKVASAIHGHLLSDGPSKVVGLDGEFGSGKSSILSILETKLTVADSDFRVCFSTASRITRDRRRAISSSFSPMRCSKKSLMSAGLRRP